MLDLRIFLFGQPRLEIDGEPRKIRRRKVAALLAYLSMASRAFSRDELAELLYPRLERNRAYAGLRQTLSYLKSEIGDGLLEVTSQSVALKSEHQFYLDVSEFHSHLTQAREKNKLDHLQAAVELYRSPFLEGFFLPDSPAFEEWQIDLTEELRYEYASAIAQLNDLYLQAGDFDQAVQSARSIVELDRLDESAQRRLIRTLASAGKKREAIRQFESFREVLGRELGADPEQATLELIREIRSRSSDRKKKTLGILPFVNLSDDLGQEYFGDGLAEDLTTALAAIPGLNIAACSTMFGFKGTSPDVRQLGRDLEITHVLEGSIQKEDNHIRINVQLIETEKGNHLWARKFDKKLTDIFSIQDVIVESVLAELEVKLAGGEQARLWRASTCSGDAYDLFLRARYNVVSPESIKRSIELLDQALAIDPHFTAALCWKGAVRILQASLLWVSEPVAAFKEAQDCFETALALDDTCADAHAGRAAILYAEKQYGDAEKLYEKALSLGPVTEFTHLFCAGFFAWKKDWLKGLSLARRAKNLCPYPHSQTYSWEICFLRKLGRLEEAYTVSKRALQIYPEGLDINVNHANVCRLLKRQNELDTALKKILEIQPDFSIEKWVGGTGIYSEKELAEYVAELHEAGFP